MTSSSPKPAARTVPTARTVRTARSARTVAALAVASTLLLSSCGGGGGAVDGAHGEHKEAARYNAADVSFARSMIPHHRQALDMAGLAHDRAGSRQVRTLAARIGKAQRPEIDRMSGWLGAWGERHGHHRSGHTAGTSGASGTDGMMGEREMRELRAARDGDFDEKFLTMMVGHHRGAVRMARTERAKGRYKPARTLASSVISSQSAEIRDMRTLRKRLRG